MYDVAKFNFNDSPHLFDTSNVRTYLAQGILW